jgi:hypothetical protein
MSFGSEIVKPHFYMPKKNLISINIQDKTNTDIVLIFNKMVPVL